MGYDAPAPRLRNNLHPGIPLGSGDHIIGTTGMTYEQIDVTTYGDTSKVVVVGGISRSERGMDSASLPEAGPPPASEPPTIDALPTIETLRYGPAVTLPEERIAPSTWHQLNSVGQ